MNKSPLTSISSDSKELGLCVKDQSGNVLSQNSVCESICGNKKGLCCSDKCMALYHRVNKNLSQIGIQFYEGQHFNDTHCEVILINDGKNLTTILLKTDLKIKDDIDFFKKYHLSDRETDVLKMLLFKKTNKEISKNLCLSVSTVRTHIAHLKNKIPEAYYIDIRN